MDIAQIVPFALFIFVASVTPGPNNVMLTAIGSSHGIVRGIPALLGISLGFGLMVLVVALGLGGIMTRSEAVTLALRWGGIAVLLWICWQIATAPVGGGSADGPGAAVGAEEGARRDRGPIGFIGAAAFQWINPKAWLVATSITSAYFTAQGDVLGQAALFFLVIAVVGTLACAPWLALGSAIGRVLATRPVVARAFNLCMAAAMLLSVLLLV